MSAAAGAPSSPVRTYGGWRRPASPGIGPLRLIPTITVLASLAILVLVAMIGGFLPAVALALLLSPVGTPAVPPWQGRTLYARWGSAGPGVGIAARGGTYRSGSPASLETEPAPCLDCRTGRCGRRRMPSAASTASLRSRRPRVGCGFRAAAQTGSLVDMDTRNVW
jgi:hypothetical protein